MFAGGAVIVMVIGRMQKRLRSTTNTGLLLDCARGLIAPFVVRLFAATVRIVNQVSGSGGGCGRSLIAYLAQTAVSLDDHHIRLQPERATRRLLILVQQSGCSTGRRMHRMMVVMRHLLDIGRIDQGAVHHSALLLLLLVMAQRSSTHLGHGLLTTDSGSRRRRSTCRRRSCLHGSLLLLLLGTAHALRPPSLSLNKATVRKPDLVVVHAMADQQADALRHIEQGEQVAQDVRVRLLRFDGVHVGVAQCPAGDQHPEEQEGAAHLESDWEGGVLTLGCMWYWTRDSPNTGQTHVFLGLQRCACLAAENAGGQHRIDDRGLYRESEGERERERELFRDGEKTKTIILRQKFN